MSRRQPENTNMAAQQWHVFKIMDMDHVNFFCQTAEIPGITLPQTTIPNPLVEVNVAGDHLDYDNLSIDFKVDENFENYLELFNWIKGLGFDENYDQHKTLTELSTIQRPVDARHSTGVLTVTNSNYNPKLEVKYVHLQPTSISRIPFDSTLEDLEYITCTATFTYDYIQIRRL